MHRHRLPRIINTHQHQVTTPLAASHHRPTRHVPEPALAGSSLSGKVAKGPHRQVRSIQIQQHVVRIRKADRQRPSHRPATDRIRQREHVANHSSRLATIDHQELLDSIRIHRSPKPLVIQCVPHGRKLTIDVAAKDSLHSLLVRRHLHTRYDPQRLATPSHEVLATHPTGQTLEIRTARPQGNVLRHKTPETMTGDTTEPLETDQILALEQLLIVSTPRRNNHSCRRIGRNPVRPDQVLGQCRQIIRRVHESWHPNPQPR